MTLGATFALTLAGLFVFFYFLTLGVEALLFWLMYGRGEG